MAKKQRTVSDMTSYCGEVPETLENHPFYGLDCSDPEQSYYRDCLWDRNVRLVIADAVAGSGKTTIAVAIALMYVRYGVCNEAYYIRTPSSEGRLGFLPGDQQTKESVYMSPLKHTLINLGENPITVINDDAFMNQKMGTGIFTTMTDVYMLGSDFSKKFVIIDEAQCMTKEQLKAVLTRCHDDCYVCVIGSSLQIQGIRPEESGLKRCIEHFKDKDWVRVCNLTKNYRGELSAWADKM